MFLLPDLFYFDFVVIRSFQLCVPFLTVRHQQYAHQHSKPLVILRIGKFYECRKMKTSKRKVCRSARWLFRLPIYMSLYYFQAVTTLLCSSLQGVHSRLYSYGL